MDVRSTSSRHGGENTAKDSISAPKRESGSRHEIPDADAKRLRTALKTPGETLGENGTDRMAGEGLASLIGQAMGGMANRAGEAGQPPLVQQAVSARPAEVETAARCGELVDRILASAPAADGSAEVRIKIDKPWLPDTEVRLTLSADSRLEVEFQADSVEAQRFLLPNLGGLRERLAERAVGDVAVRMTEQASEGGGDNGDGRSRNRRSVVEEYDGD